MKKNKLYSEFTSRNEDGSIEVIENPIDKTLVLTINDGGQIITITYNMDLFVKYEYDKLSAVRDVIRKANLLFRASATIKNHLKKTLFPALETCGDITPEECKQYMGNTIKD